MAIRVVVTDGGPTTSRKVQVEKSPSLTNWAAAGPARKRLHLSFGWIAAISSVIAMVMIDIVASYMLTPRPPGDTWGKIFNPTMIYLDTHRIVGNLTWTGFGLAGLWAIGYLRAATADERAFFRWAGGVCFGGEVTQGSDPLKTDSDGDGLCDGPGGGAWDLSRCVGSEPGEDGVYQAGQDTDPADSDSDGDKLCDGFENGASDCQRGEDQDGDRDPGDYNGIDDPETNPLVPLDSTAEGSNCPTSKSVIIRLERPSGQQTGGGTPAGRGDEDKRHVEPEHLA